MRKISALAGAAAIIVLAAGWEAHAQTRLTLRDALEMTGKQNPDIQLARLRATESEARAAQTKAAYLPQATVNAGFGYQTNNLQGIGLFFPGVPSRIGPYRTFNARPVVTQTIVDLSLLSNIRAARQRTGIANSDAATIREDAMLAVLQLYLQALQADSRVAASTARLATAEAILKQAQDRERNGTASQLDIARAREQVETEAGVRIAAARDGQILKTLLAKAIGIDQAGELLLEKPSSAMTPDTEAEAARAALENRSELQSLDGRRQLARLEQQSSERQRWPRVTATGDYGLLGAGPDRSVSTYTVGASISVPLWTGRRIESEITAARVQSSIVEQELRRQKLAIGQEIRQSVIEWQAATDAQAAADRQARAARESLDLARLRFENGLATSVDTQVAQSSLAQADDTRIRAEYDMLLAAARHARAKGDVLQFVR